MRNPFKKQNKLRQFYDVLKEHNERINASMRIGSLSFAAMLSMFPALLAFTAVMQKLLASNPSLRKSVTESTWANFPVVGDIIQGQLKTPTFGVGVLVSIAILIWSASSVFKNLRDLLMTLWSKPGRPPKTTFVKNAAVGLIATLAFGASFALSAILQGLIAANDLPASYLIGLFLGAVLIGLCLELAFYILYSIPGWKAYLPTSVICAVLFSILQLIGTQFVAHSLKRMTPRYGTIAVFLTLAVWINLHMAVVVWSHVYTRSRADYSSK